MGETLDELTICGAIEKVPGGYIVYVRWPFGPRVTGTGPVVCRTWTEVLALLERCGGKADA